MARRELHIKTNTGKWATVRPDVAKFEKKGKDAFVDHYKREYAKALKGSASEEKIADELGKFWDVVYPVKKKAE